MGKVDWNKSYEVICGVVDNGGRYRQDGKLFDGQGIEIDDRGNIVDPSDLIPDEPKEEVPKPLNNKQPEFQKDWHKDQDPPNEYKGLAWGNTPEGKKPPSDTTCDVCGFVSKSKFGLQSHKRIKHKQ